MYKKVRKAVIPAAGFGIRMLPFTKAVPKELVPLAAKPVIQHIVEEASSAGIEEILLIISEGKEALINHFAAAPELTEHLLKSGRKELAESLQIAENCGVRISYAWQRELKGLGDAVALARDFAGGEAVAVLLGDTVMESGSDVPVIGQLLQLYEQYGSTVVAVAEVPEERLSGYGVVGGTEISPGVVKVERMVEKPAPGEAPGNLAVAARYVLTPGIYDCLSSARPGKNGEIQLTDALVSLLQSEPVYACKIAGRRFDLGNWHGFIAANVEFALRCDDAAGSMRKMLTKILKEAEEKSVQ